MKIDNISELNDFSQLKVLIIDDNLLVHNTLRNTLSELGINSVKSAQNAFYGMSLCDQQSFHVIICAFNVKSDKDGFHLLEELKFKRHVTKTTVLIFLSSATDESLVNSVVELQPDDFWVKPLSGKTVKSRFIDTLKVKKKLFNIYRAIDDKAFSKAIYYADRHLLDLGLTQYHSNILRMKGESLLSLCEYEQAETFYHDLLSHYKYGWVQLGYVKALLKQHRIDEIHDLLSRLVDKPETRFGAHDMLAQYYIESKDYARAYQEIKHATSLSPRNIERNRKSWDLARLNHDHQGQYIATQNIALYAKNSIHDSPQLLLNVIRAGIDLANTISDNSSSKLLKKTDDYIQQLENNLEAKQLFKEQLLVARARLHNVRGDSERAEKIIQNHVGLQYSASLEDNLDKVKVLHELGLREQAIALLEEIKQQISTDSLTGQVAQKYVEQEAQQRKNIFFTAKQLNEMAKEHFHKRRVQPALDSILQALALAPNNIKLTMRLLKILIAIKDKNELDQSHRDLASKTMKILENSVLETKAKLMFHNMKLEWY
jgi:CheY-like chemotaxis protein